LSAALIIQQNYRVQGMEEDNRAAMTVLARSGSATFEQVFKTHFKRLLAYAFTIIRDEAAAEEMVQQVFCKLWERNRQLSVTGSVTAYLYRAVHNESLNYLKHLKVKTAHQLHVAYSMKNEVENPCKTLQAAELERNIHAAMNELPEQCRLIFQLSRFEELKYREIADKLGLSVKTVENQMGKALRLLRVRLVDFLMILFAFFHL
jgi:RNA polymerase sigma-70 factor, ECF subfamily